MDKRRDISINNLDLDFEFDDYLDRLRDERMIEIHEAEISADYLDIEDYYAEYDPLDAQIESLEEYSPYNNYLNFKAYEDYILECELVNNNYYLCTPLDDYVEEINMDGAYCEGRLGGYVVNDDEFDGFGECDYPEGPSENLGGFAYPEPEYFYDDSFMDFECQIDAYDEMQSIHKIQENYKEYLVECQESHMEKLIEKHIREENEFLDYVNEYEVLDEYYLPPGTEGIIFT